MKRLVAMLCALVVSVLIMSSKEGQSAETWEEQHDPYRTLANGFDADFLQIKKIESLINLITDFGLRILGYESSSYTDIKNMLGDEQGRLDILLAVIAADKCPRETDAKKAFSRLMENIETDGFCTNKEVFKNKVSYIGQKSEYEYIYKKILSLNKQERQAIRLALIALRPFAGVKGYRDLSEEEVSAVSSCLASIET